MSMDKLLAKNRAWAAYQVAQDPDYFKRHSKGQQPRYLWIGCADSRVPAEQILGCPPGELFVHRNVANIVSYNDVNIASVLQYGLHELHIEDVIVCGHYGCGGVKASCADKVVTGYVGDWLMIAGWAKRWVEERLAQQGKPRPDEEAFLELVVEENVRLQVKHLANLSMVREQWEKNSLVPRLHAWVYDIHTGHIKVVDQELTGKGRSAPATAEAAPAADKPWTGLE